jgi:hypothetical protein
MARTLEEVIRSAGSRAPDNERDVQAEWYDYLHGTAWDIANGYLEVSHDMATVIYERLLSLLDG